jgi:hypothetical protein
MTDDEAERMFLANKGRLAEIIREVQAADDDRWESLAVSLAVFFNRGALAVAALTADREGLAVTSGVVDDEDVAGLVDCLTSIGHLVRMLHDGDLFDVD